MEVNALQGQRVLNEMLLSASTIGTIRNDTNEETTNSKKDAQRFVRPPQFAVSKANGRFSMYKKACIRSKDDQDISFC